MDDPTVYLEKLSLFARMLRRDGLTVGVQETADASQILISLGLSEEAVIPFTAVMDGELEDFIFDFLKKSKA